MAEQTVIDSQTANWFTQASSYIGDSFDAAMGLYGKYLEVQKVKDATGQAQLETNQQPYVTTNVQTQPLTPEQMAQAAGQNQTTGATGQLIPGVDNKLLMLGGVIAFIALMRR